MKGSIDEIKTYSFATVVSKLSCLWLPLLLLLCCSNNGAAANIGRCASCAPTSTEVGTEVTSSGYGFEVFLSFRGPDTRAAFTNFLYTSLRDLGIRTYMDDVQLRAGEEIGPELLQAINQSKISMPIFSKGYASSVWCLKELVQMVECWKTRGQIIMPIFYDVAPSEVRYQTGVYRQAFRSHANKKRYKEETIRGWEAALSAVGSLKGWDLHNMTDRRECQFARTIAHEVFNELKKACLLIPDYLVYVDHHVDEIMKMIGAQTRETRIVGIYGMNGIGKTTIAKIVYNQLSGEFKNCCFLSNIREKSKLKGIECLQNQLISDILRGVSTDIGSIDEGTKMIQHRLSDKRVLLLLDDVNEKSHMDALLVKRDWFGEGSKVIITTRRTDLLFGINSYEVTGMNPAQSRQLFSKHAFKRDSPPDEYINQSKKAVDIADGLPLALEAMGSLLFRTEKEKWDIKLEKWESVPHEEVKSKLKKSYDELDGRQKLIFLDRACFFIGYDKDILIDFWNQYELFPQEAMEVLENRSLIKIKRDNKVWMQKQLRNLGREMVREESKMKIEKQSRVWIPEEGFDLLTSNEEEKEVEALRLKPDHQHCFTYENFMRLPNLRFLEVDGSIGNFCA